MNKTAVFCTSLILGVLNIGYPQQVSDTLKVQNLKEVVLSDSRFALKRENSGKVITKITSETLDQLQGQSIAEIINRTAGIEVNGVRSNAGQNLSYSVRGGRNRQVLIMIDGIQVNDPSQIANDYDLRLLNADQVESIEILKGASSTLYGSGAATAVINISLKEALEKPCNLNIRSTLGSNQSADENNYALEDFRNSVAINGTVDKVNYLASFGHQYTDGLSAIEAGTESDPFNAYNGILKLSYEFNDCFRVTTFGSLDHINVAFDDSFSGLDADNNSISEQYRFGVSPEYKYENGSVIINAAYNIIERRVESAFPSLFNAESIVVDAFNRYNFRNKFYAVLGLNYQNNQMESFTIPFSSNDFELNIDSKVADFEIIDPYVNVVYVSTFGLNMNAGIRLNNHSTYGSKFIYNLNPSYREDFDFGYIKGLLSYSTAYITPSLFQLYEPSFGNRDLRPEENQTFELGAELFLNDFGQLSVVYFKRNEENFIDFIDTGGIVFQYQNITEEFKASGLELELLLKLFKGVGLTGNLTYTMVEEDLNLRIPELMVNTRIDYKPFRDTTVSLSYQFNGERTDSFFNNASFENEQVLLDAFGLLDFYVSQKILRNKMTVFANVTNLFNEDYQELFGFTTRGRNFNIGFNLQL